MNKKQAAITLLSLSLLATTMLQTTNATETSNQTFSIIWITDTQYLTENNPVYYDNLCQWMVNNDEAYNVKMVVHTGDIVNQEGNLTQWANANQSMSILLGATIPYCWCAGNHDYNSTCWLGNHFSAFAPSTMQNQTWWVSSESGGMSTAVHFNVSGWDCLIISIAYNANDTTLDWVNGILDANPQSHAIIATHAYIDRQNLYDTWALNLQEKVLNTHANVFLTLSGHYYPTPGNHVKVGERDELLFNQQDTNDHLGAVCVRVLTFDVEKGALTVQTFSLLSNQFLGAENNNFTLYTSFRNNSVGRDEFPYLFVVLAVCVVCILVLVWFKCRFDLKS